MTSRPSFTTSPAARLLALLAVAGSAHGCGSDSVLDPSAEVVFHGARVWDGTGAETTGPALVQVAAGRILSVTPLPEGVDLAAAAAGTDVIVVDASDRFIVPGLINVHGHVAGTWSEEVAAGYAEQVEADLERYARFGVTTVNSLGGEQEGAVPLRDASWTDEAPGRARLLIAGDVVVGPGVEEAVAMVEANAEMGADWIKIRVDDNLGATAKMAPDVYQAVIDRTHALGLPLAAHLFYQDDAKALLQAGADLVAHSVRDREVDPELIGLFRETGVCYVPTLTREVSTFVYGERPDFFDDPFLMSDVDERQVLAVSDPDRRAAIAQSRTARAYRIALDIAQHNLKRLSESDVSIAMGTDTGPLGRFQGYFEHMELSLMAESGLSTQEILRSATGVAAQCLRRDDIGTLEAGRRADLIVLTEDPMTGVEALRSIESVWVGGQRIEGSNKLP